MPHWPLKILWLLLPLPLLAAAPSAKQQAPIIIEAERMELNQRQGTSHYQGKVLLQQGGLQIRANSIILHSTNKRLQRAVATGQPATLQQQQGDNGDTMRAEAARMEYLPETKVVVLEGGARLWHNGNEFSGEKIRYDLQQRQIKASGDTDGNGRVRVLLQPQDESKQTEKRP